MPPKKKVVTDQQKKAMAEGRADSRVVKRYLEALEQNKPKRGRKRTPQSIQKRLMEIDSTLESADPLKAVNLVQERMDLTEELSRLSATSEVEDAEKEFIDVAQGYAERKGISYAAWREVGVPAATLKAAGITRGS